jgi:hypothetical protein
MQPSSQVCKNRHAEVPFRVRVTDFWNRLEPEIRDSMINKQFKTQLKAKIVPLVGTVHNVLERRLENTNYRICLKEDGRVMKLDNRRQSEAYHESKDVSTTCLQWHIRDEPTSNKYVSRQLFILGNDNIVNVHKTSSMSKPDVGLNC